MGFELKPLWPSVAFSLQWLLGVYMTYMRSEIEAAARGAEIVRPRTKVLTKTALGWRLSKRVVSPWWILRHQPRKLWGTARPGWSSLTWSLAMSTPVLTWCARYLPNLLRSFRSLVLALWPAN